MTEFWEHEFFRVGSRPFTVHSLFSILAILVVARLLVWLIGHVVHKRLRKLKRVDGGRSYAITAIAKYIIYALAAVLLIDAAGVNVTVLVAGSTALFVGLGFGLQNTFNDFVSGVILLFEGALEVDDIVEVNGVLGRVTSIGLRTSHIETKDQTSIIVPNSKFISENVINWSHQIDQTRLRISVGVAYGSDVPLVREVLISVANSHPEIQKVPGPDVFFSDFGDSALLFELLFWLEEPFESERILSEVRFGIEAAFQQSDIKIPFPQRDLHIVSSAL